MPGDLRSFLPSLVVTVVSFFFTVPESRFTLEHGKALLPLVRYNIFNHFQLAELLLVFFAFV